MKVNLVNLHWCHCVNVEIYKIKKISDLGKKRHLKFKDQILNLNNFETKKCLWQKLSKLGVEEISAQGGQNHDVKNETQI